MSVMPVKRSQADAYVGKLGYYENNEDTPCVEYTRPETPEGNLKLPVDTVREVFL
jgi:hypothetical protein